MLASRIWGVVLNMGGEVPCLVNDLHAGEGSLVELSEFLVG